MRDASIRTVMHPQFGALVDFAPEDSPALYVLHSVQVPAARWHFPHLDRRQMIWLIDICLRALEMLPTEILDASKDNPWEILTPFIRAMGACWLDRSSQLREHSRWPSKSIADISDPPRYLQELEQAIDNLRYMGEMIDTLFGGPPANRQHPIMRDLAHVVHRFELMHRATRERLNYEASIASLKESRLGIQQNQSVKRLTQLAFVFIPMSLVASVFGMNIDLLSGQGAKWWTVIIGAAIVYALLAIPFCFIILEDKIGKWKERRKETMW